MQRINNQPFVLFDHKSKQTEILLLFKWAKRFCLLTCLCCPQAKLQEGFQHRRYLLSGLLSRHSACFQSDGAQRARTALCHWQGEALRVPASEHPKRERKSVKREIHPEDDSKKKATITSSYDLK